MRASCGNFPSIRKASGRERAAGGTPADSLWEMICDEIAALAPKGSGVKAVGVALPGMIRSGVVEDSPNLPQLKGARVGDAVRSGLKARGLEYPVCAMNDADAVAAGLAAMRGHLDRLIRVWTMGTGLDMGGFRRRIALGRVATWW